MSPRTQKHWAKDRLMKAKFLVAVLITASLASAVACAQRSLPEKPTYSHSELIHLIHTSHSQEQFKELSDYFDRKQQEYVQKSETERIELNRRLAAPCLSPKYPTPVDT